MWILGTLLTIWTEFKGHQDSLLAIVTESGTKVNIKGKIFIMEKNKLENTILEYMEAHHTVSLATEKNGVPHAATVFFINIGFDLYFFSSSTSRHGDNFSQNPMVSATINEDYSEWRSIKGIQMEGVVENIGGILKNPRISKKYVKKFPGVADFLFSPKKLGEAIAKKVAGVDYYRLIPSKIYFLNNELGFGHRDELIP